MAFSGTVFDNLTLGDPSVTEDTVIAAATIAGADSFIRMLPGGYQTMLSGSGGGTAVRLSAGQEPLLALRPRAGASPCRVTVASQGRFAALLDLEAAGWEWRDSA